MAVPGFFSGCATSAPPGDAPRMAGPKWPPTGSTWVANRKTNGSFGISTGQVTYRLVGKTSLEGRDLVAINDGAQTFYFEEGGDWVARARGETVLDRAEPSVVNYEWPLVAGKWWNTTFTYRDIEHNRTYSNVRQNVTVDRYEEVQTPAGRFNAFKIIREDPAYRIIYWISPDLGIWVKWREERLSGHYLGGGLSESELASYQFQQ
jgi:hypothetical protein